MKRSKHSLSHYVLSTFNMGNLVPVGWYDVLPGDSIRQQTSMLIRVSPLVTPVMHPVSVRLHHWYVPLRILWDEFEPFITGGTDGEGDGAVFPVVSTAAIAATAGGLADYLGIQSGAGAALNVSQMPFRAYNKIYNENYRDQDLQSEVGELSGDIQPVAWEKDIFTAARPWTQKGPTVTLPLGTVAPVVSDGNAPTFSTGVGSWPGPVNQSALQANNGSATPGWMMGAYGGTSGPVLFSQTGLEADLSAATAADVNSLRLAMALQRWQEARAQFGSRYTEYLRYLGIRSSDARLQRPEYLGGGRATISFSEVLNTGGQDDGADVPTGNLSGHGISAMRTRPYVRFFEEHGIVMTLASIRPKSIYVNGLDRKWSKFTREDFYQRELEQIGQQEVYNRELKLTHASPDGVFGYQDRYSEYRSQQSYVTGQFRSTLNDWHFGRIFGTDPALNASFIECDPGVRPFADQTAGANHMWAMVSHSIQARRMVGNRTIGRIM